MKAPAIFTESETSYTETNFDIVVLPLAGGAAADTTGWTLKHSQRGTYELDVPAITIGDYTYFLQHKTIPAVKADGFISNNPAFLTGDYDAAKSAASQQSITDLTTAIGSITFTLTPQNVQDISDSVAAVVGTDIAQDLWSTYVPDLFEQGTAGYEVGRIKAVIDKFIEAVGQLLSGSYQAGVVNIPGAVVPGDTLIFYTKTDCDDIQFPPLSEYWIPYLQDPDTEVWFTMKTNARAVTLTLDVQGSVFSALDRICRLSLTAAQLNISAGDFFWQLQLRKSVTTGTPPDTVTVIQRRITLEGKALVKPTFKG